MSCVLPCGGRNHKVVILLPNTAPLMRSHLQAQHLKELQTTAVGRARKQESDAVACACAGTVLGFGGLLSSAIILTEVAAGPAGWVVLAIGGVGTGTGWAAVKTPANYATASRRE
jgi:hypothetical protein